MFGDFPMHAISRPIVAFLVTALLGGHMSARADELCPASADAVFELGQTSVRPVVADNVVPGQVRMMLDMLRGLGLNVKPSPGGLLYSMTNMSVSQNLGPETRIGSGYCVTLNKVSAKIGYSEHQIILQDEVAKDPCLAQEVTANLTDLAHKLDARVSAVIPGLQFALDLALHTYRPPPAASADEATKNATNRVMQPITKMIAVLEQMRDQMEAESDAAFLERAGNICDGRGAAIFRVAPTQPKL